MMKIAIVHDFLTKIGGAEKVLMKVHELYPDAPIFTLLYDKEGTKNQFEEKNYTIIPSKLNHYPHFIRIRPKLLLGKYAQAIEEFDFSQYDIVISLSNSFAHGVITKPNTLHISYCHSPMRYAWDWTNEYLKENKIRYGLIGLYIRNLLKKIRLWDQISSKRVDVWLANSKTVQSRIKKYYRAESEVIYPPTKINKISKEEIRSEEFYVIISRLEPYKKIDLAIEAFNKNSKNLIIIGKGSQYEELKKQARKNIEFLGWQKDESVQEYLKNCKALIFPGEEDFGLTPIEAMSCGKPVIAYAKGGVLETVIDGKTGIFFKEQSAASLNEAINNFEENSQSFTVKNCIDQANKFSDEIFSEKFQKAISKNYQKYKEQIND